MKIHHAVKAAAWLLAAVAEASFVHNRLTRKGGTRATAARVALQAGEQLDSSNGDSTTQEQLSVVVVGGGWAGFSAADAISSRTPGIQVHLLDASPRGPGGLAAGWRTPKLKRPVEAGIHGFWREYRNTFAVIERLGLDLDEVLTPFTPSTLISANGKVAVAPVLGEGESEAGDGALPSAAELLPLLGSPEKLVNEIGPLLPPPLDVALLTELDENSKVRVVDRLSGLGLLGAWADFEQEDRTSWLRYDQISADNLFRRVAALSPRLYDELVTPLLHVLPMAPGWDCSAAAALSCFHVFALQARGAFDVRWCRGSITEKIFNPWTQQLQQRGNVQVRGASKVTRIEEVASTENNDKPFVVTINDDGSNQIACNAVVLAVGATTAGRLIDACPPLQSIEGLATQWKQLRGITCVAVRIFVDAATGAAIRGAMSESPVAVCGPSIGAIPALLETGFCLYDLGRLQDEFQQEESDGVCAFEVDYFRANAIAAQDDNQVMALTLAAIAKALNTKELEADNVLDFSVFRARNAVSHFSVGSAALSPAVRLKKGWYVCGDWVDRTGHASWSTEKAVVTGRQAASALGADFGVSSTIAAVDVVAAAPDTPALQSLRQVSALIRQVVPRGTLPPAPWTLAARLLGR